MLVAYTLDNVYVGDSRHGKGIFAARKILKGELVLAFTGPTVSYDETWSPEISHYCLQIDSNRGLYVVPDVPGRFTNHSCEPNTGLADDRTLVALRDVERGEEITFDYSTCMDEDAWTLECACGAENCRGIIKDFKYLPQTLRQHYTSLGIVPDWLSKAFVQRVSGIAIRMQ